MGSDSDCLLGQSNGILEKTGGVDGGERVCGDATGEALVRARAEVWKFSL